MVLFKKLKKVKKSSLIIYNVVLIGYLISLIFFVRSTLSLVGIETMIRIIALSFFTLLLVVYLFIGLTTMITKKKSFYVLSAIMFLFIPIFSVGSFFIDKTMGKIVNINKNEVTYTSVLLSLKDNDINNTSIIGMINDESDIEGYVLAKKLLSKNSLENDIKEYEDYYVMMDDLLNGTIDGLIISSNYELMFNSDNENNENENNNYSDLSSKIKIKYTYSEKIEKKENVTKKKLTEPFTLLLIGVDSTSNDLVANAAFNGDTLILITFNPNTLSMTMLSIPRDTYVPISCRNNNEAKINTASYGGSSCILKTISNYTGIDIDYYIKMNFKGLVNLVNALDGIDVEVPYSLCEQNSSRQWGEHTIYVESGLQHLNGEQSLALARNRKYRIGHCDSKYTTDGIRNDFQRGLNQQLVVEGIAKKAKTINSVDEVYDVLDVITNSMDTNMSVNQILSFYEVGKDILIKLSKYNDTSFISIEKLYLQTKYLEINGRSMEIGQKKSLNVIINAMKINLGLSEPIGDTTFSYDVSNPYSKSLLGKGLYDGISYDLLPDFRGKTKEYVVNWASRRNIKIEYLVSNVANYASGIVTKQSVSKGNWVEKISSLKIYVNE